MIDLKNRSSDSRVFPSIAMFQPAPSWSVVDQAPSDCALLARAKTLRSQQQKLQRKFQDIQGEEETDEGINSCAEDECRVAKVYAYPLAAAAVGCSQKQASSLKKMLLLFVGALVVLLVFLSADSSPFHFGMQRPVRQNNNVSQLPAPRRRSRAPKTDWKKKFQQQRAVSAGPSGVPASSSFLSPSPIMEKKKQNNDTIMSIPTVKTGSKALMDMIQVVRFQFDKIGGLLKKFFRWFHIHKPSSK